MQTVLTSGCVVGSTGSWRVQYYYNAPGLSQQGAANVYNESSCRAACEQIFNCLSIDYNNQDKTCWFGYSANPQTVPNQPVNHWDLTKKGNCGGKN